MTAFKRACWLLMVGACLPAVAGCGTSRTTARLYLVAPARAPEFTVSVGAESRGRPIPAGFLGLSFEYSAIEPYAGIDPNAVNPVLVHLIENLNPGQAPVLRIGGDSTDWAWWPVPGMRRPGGVRITLDRRWLEITSSLTRALSASLILGINLEAGSKTLAAREAAALVGALPAGSIQAFELGNEPELYNFFAWYRLPGGRAVLGRPRGYDFAAFMHEFAQFGALMSHVKLAGPTTGAERWIKQVPRFVAGESGLGVVTLHAYPLVLCGAHPPDPYYPTLAHLLAPLSSIGLANTVAPFVPVIHAHGVPVRVDEMNSIGCGSAPAVGESFASALWSLDALFEMARAGVDSVNIHTYPGTTYELFRFHRSGRRWQGTVEPQYYGLLMFAQAAPPSSRLLAVSGVTNRQIKAWATRGADNRVRLC